MSSTSTSPTPSEDPTPSTTTTIIPPLSPNHTHTIIFLHGREDFGSDLAQYFFNSKSSSGQSLAELFPTFRFVFPTAKLRYCAQRDFEFSNSSFADALKGEEIISQWFDVWDLKEREERKELMVDGLRGSMEQIEGIVGEEAKLVPCENIILGGISQGCATAMFTLLALAVKVGGFVGLCSWLPFGKEIGELSQGCTIEEISRSIHGILDEAVDGSQEKLSGLTQVEKQQECAASSTGVESAGQSADVNKLEASSSAFWVCGESNTPVFLAHPKDDETVPFEFGKELCQTVKHLGFEVEWKEYEDGGHWIHGERGVDDMATFIRRVMKL